MGTVYRKTVTKALPAGAELFTKSGKRYARWSDAKGKKRTTVVTTAKDGAERIVVESKTFVAKYRDGNGFVREISTGCKDEQAARAVLGQLEKRAENVRSGIVTADDDAVRDHLQTPIETHLNEYDSHIKTAGLSDNYRKNTLRQLRAMFKGCRFVLLRDLSIDGANAWLAAKAQGGMSARTRNSHRSDAVTFCNWLVERKRLKANPFSSLCIADESVDQRRQRRALNESELRKLLHVALWRPLAEYGRTTIRVEKPDSKRKRSGWTYAELTFDDLDNAIERARKRLADNPELVARLERLGRERQLIYKTLVLTGLRRNELASLKNGNLHLDGDVAFVELTARNAKDREDAAIPLRADLADELRAWLRSKANNATTLSIASHGHLDAGESLFSVPSGLVKILDRDLRFAGIAKKDALGRTVDVHALRHSFATLLSKGGIAPRIAQSAMRHSSVDLTMKVYSHIEVHDVAGALDVLPRLPLDEAPESTAQRATGTFGRVVPKDAPKSGPQFAPGFAPTTNNLVQTGSSSGNEHAFSVGEIAGAEASTCDAQNSEKPNKKGPSEANSEGPDSGVGDGGRTRDLQIHNLAL